MWRSIASNGFNLLILLALLIGALAVWGKAQYYNAGPLGNAICLQVDRGTTMRSLSQTLYEKNAISSAAIFRMGAEYTGKAGDLKAGNFLLDTAISMADITEIVTKGGANSCGAEVVYRIGITATQVQVREMDPSTSQFEEKVSFTLGQDAPEAFKRLSQEVGIRHRLAIAEGVTSFKIVEALNEIDVLSGEVLNIPPEGTLAPDSFELRQGDDRQALLLKMQAAQEAILNEAWDQREEGLPITSKEDALILASIIEKETGQTDERALVASVFVNRLNKGMPLQTDPSVIYGITLGKDILGRGLRQSELRKDTPWNTYVNKGLPKTPIANPGRKSILAAVSPAQSDYLFFVADGSGGHAFAVTLAEHNKNVAKWRAIEAERRNSQGD
ncbi:MAG: endolytic transglycosylase MltG [Paracoccaceae bacterium]